VKVVYNSLVLSFIVKLFYVSNNSYFGSAYYQNNHVCYIFLFFMYFLFPLYFDCGHKTGINLMKHTLHMFHFNTSLTNHSQILFGKNSSTRRQ
jgi:hypothetical protein